MRNATELLAQYAEYHRDRRNIVSHFVGVPMIVFGVGVLQSGCTLNGVYDAPTTVSYISGRAATDGIVLSGSNITVSNNTTCSGLSGRAYFEAIRKARAAVKIPPEYLELSDAKTVAPADVEDAFVKVNPGLTTSAIAVTCNRTRLSEVRICLDKDLQFRPCDEIDRRGCRRDQVTMPPIRGG